MKSYIIVDYIRHIGRVGEMKNLYTLIGKRGIIIDHVIVDGRVLFKCYLTTLSVANIRWRRS
jgi:hypothetical protein